MRFKICKSLFFILGLIIFFTISCFVILSFSQKQESEQPFFVIENNEIWQIYPEKKENQLTDDGFEKSSLEISPDQKRIGYYRHLYSKPIYHDQKSYYENYLAFMVYDLDTEKEREIFRGNYQLGDWEWIDSKEIVLYQSCGTECVGFWRIDIETGEKNPANFGVNYQWSPDKKYVLAYHYTLCGITVGDKFGNTIFNLRREKNKIFPKLAEKTQGFWSPDSKKLALIIKKENEEELEFLIFDVVNNFQIIYQNDFKNVDFNDFPWITVPLDFIGSY